MPKFPQKNIVDFLCTSKKEEGYKLLFKKIEKLEYELKNNQIDYFGRALAKLYPKNLYIMNLIEDWIQNEKEVLQKNGKELRKYITIQASY